MRTHSRHCPECGHRTKGHKLRLCRRCVGDLFRLVSDASGYLLGGIF